MTKRKTPKKAKPVKMAVEMTEEKAQEIAQSIDPMLDTAVARIILDTFDELVEKHEGNRETAVMELIDMGEKIMKN